MASPRTHGRQLPPLGRAAFALALASVCLHPALTTPAQAAAPPSPTRVLSARPHTRPAALPPWELAERARDSFEATPDTARTRAGYTRVMDRFRAIYHDNPGDPHAPEAINAVAELLTEQGRTLGDPRCFRAALGQYEFLRSQYPTSSLRVGALLAEAEIAQNDLHDPASARERYQTLVDQYPHSALAGQARDGLLSLRSAHGSPAYDAGDGLRHTASARSSGNPREARQGSAAPATRLAANQTSAPQTFEAQTPKPQPLTSQPLTSQTLSTSIASPSRSAAEVSPSLPNSAEASQDAIALPPPRQVAHRAGPLATVSGIRHWSTPTYTRVAIDLGTEVEYEAARVPSPDRIFFDLHGARLAPDLAGKSFAVTDDGFLKRIRIAQSGSDVTRVVLDVNDVTEYSAFLLPNPYRLIIDIHGRPKSAAQLAAQSAAARYPSVDAPAPHAATVPNTRAMRAGSPADVDSLSNQPGKIEATSTPTSQPIAATVAGRGYATNEAATASNLPPATPSSRPKHLLTTPSSRPERGPGSPASERHSLEWSGSGVEGPASSPAINASATNTTPADARIVGESNPAATARAIAAGKHTGKKRATPADARVVGDPATPARAAAIHTADGETSLVRALGLKINRIVIDAGHGGHDSGTLGVGGLQEKDVVLDVALRLGALLHDRLGAEVIYTRSDDTFIPLETRTALANKAQADLFLSIHANSSPDSSARGVETYYLNFTQQADALEVAARENAVSGQSVSQLSDLVRKITLKDKLAESREFATDVETSLYSGLAHPAPAPAATRTSRGESSALRGSLSTGNLAAGPSFSAAAAPGLSTAVSLAAGPSFKDRGVKKAPFVVLIGANMPSVLAEISFLTNPRDATLLLQPDYKQRVAESLFRGIARYVNSLSSTAPAVVQPTERAATGQ